MPNTIPAAGEAMPTTSYSLQATIYRYKGGWMLYLAQTLEAEERGENDDAPETYKTAMHALERWDRPAETMEEAIMALELALADYEVGDTPRIPAMMKAAMGWMQAEAKRRLAQ